MSTTRGTSTSSVGSTPSLHDYSGVQVYTTTPGFKSTRLHQHPSAVSGLRVLAPVSGLLCRIQPARLPTDPGLR
jgi:hypothetical protein